MPSDDLILDFMKRTDKALEKTDKALGKIQTDVNDLMKFRWMVMGGAAVASFLFTIIFEIAKVWAGGK